MALLTKLYTFIADAVAEPDEVNVNFDDIVGFVNNEVVHKDGSKAFTAHPSGPATDPTAANQYARKAYVDAKTAGIEPGDLLRLKGPNATVVSRGGLSANPSINQVVWDAGSHVGTLDAGGNFTINFHAAMNPISIVVTNGDANSDSDGVVSVLAVNGTSSFSIHVANGNVGSLFRVDWIAIGYPA